MSSLTWLKHKSALVLIAAMGGIIVTSCAAEQSSLPTANAPASAPEMAQKSEVADTNNQATSGANAQPAKPVPRPLPQLIKKAAMTLIVDDVDQSVQAVRTTVTQQRGDLIGLQDYKPEDNNSRRTAQVELRVPQNVLETTLEALAKLGTVQNRSITAEDVGNQLVDLKARLTNLQKTESNLQKIIDKAASVRDVLSVSKELSNVRESIEQINAQLQSLQNQVSYSTITLKLEAAVAGSSPDRAVSTQVQETWNNSTRSLGEFSTGLLKLGIWLMVYSPYLLILAVAAYGVNRMRRSSRRALPQPPTSTNHE